MAVTKIKPIRGTVNKAIAYIIDPKKTDDELLVSSFGCAASESAAKEFEWTRNLAAQQGAQIPKVIARHLIQSFDVGEVSPEVAHEIGKQFADEWLKGKYEYVIATHIDKGHCHNHIIFNAVNFVDYHSYRSNKRTYRELRLLSDEICKEHGLSVIPPSQNKGMDYKEYTEAKKGTSWKQKLKQTIDRLVITAKDYDEFLKLMQEAGYEIKTGKYISFRAAGQERFTRAKTIGENYTEERIKERIAGRNPRKRRMQIERKGISLIIDIQNSIKAQESKDEKKLLSNRLSISDLTRPFFEEFIQWLKSCRKCSISTCNQRSGAIHAFFIYLQYEMPEAAAQCQEVLAIRTAKAPEGQLNYLTVEGIAALLAQPDISTKAGRRDAALLSLLYDSGARVQELVDLTIGDVRFISPATVKLTGKGRKTRIVPLLSGPESLLRAYMKDYNLEQAPSTHPLFCNRSGTKFTRAGIAYTLKKYADMARNTSPDLIPETVTPHCLRHSKAMHLLQANVNLIYIRDLLGHSEIKTTEIYARADTSLKRQALEKASPVNQQIQYPAWTDDDDLMNWLNSFGK